MVGGESPQKHKTGPETPAGTRERGETFSERQLRDHVPAELRNVSFPLAVRGYDRAAVDTYVKRVNHVIAELEVSRSPRAAVRHALDRATEDVSSILQRAQETAEEITASARKEAEESAARTGAQAAKLLVDANDEADRTRAEADKVLTKAKAEAEKTLATAKAEAEKTLATAKAEAEEILGRARTEGSERLQRSEKEIAVLRELSEARMRDLHADTEIVRGDRRELLDDLSGMAARLTELAREAGARFPSREPDEPEEVSPPEVAEPEAGAEANTEAAEPPPAEAGQHGDGDREATRQKPS